jgi:hypothetical protein
MIRYLLGLMTSATLRHPEATLNPHEFCVSIRTRQKDLKFGFHESPQQPLILLSTSTLRLKLLGLL